MPESSGLQVPRGNVLVGHRHVDLNTGLIFRYLGGDPSDVVRNWLVDGGITDSDPDTSQWDTRQAGAHWFNRQIGEFRIWNGVSIVASDGKGIQTVSISSGVLSIDPKFGAHVRVTLDQNVTTMSLQSSEDGQKIVIEMTQDATGGRTVAWASNVRFSTDIPSSSFVPDATALKKTYFGLIYHGVDGVYDAVAITKGF